MHILVGSLFGLIGGGFIAHAVTGSAAWPPVAAVGVLFVAVGFGIWRRSRGARLLALGGLGAMLLAIAYGAATGYRAPGPATTGEDIVEQARLLSSALAAAAVVALLFLVRRVRTTPAFGRHDWILVAGAAVALGVGVVGRLGGDAPFRPCRLGNDAACEMVATVLLEAAERAPAAPPTPWEERAALVLVRRDCRGAEPPCGVQLYAIGSVAVRAGRREAAKDAFLRACDVDPGWCARAAQEAGLSWTPAERERLTRQGP